MPWIEKEGRTVEEAQDAAIAAAGRPADELEIEVLREGAKGLFGLGGETALVRVRPREEARDVRAAFRDDLAASSRTEDSTEPPEPRAPEQAPTAAPSEPAPAETPSEPAPAEVQPEPAPAETPSEPTSAEAQPAPPPSSQEQHGQVDEEEDEAALPVAERQAAAAEVGIEMVKGVLERMGLEGEVGSRVQGGTVYIEVFGEDMGILIGRGGATLEALQELVRAGVRRRVKARQAVVVDVEAYWERRRGRRRGGNRDDHD